MGKLLHDRERALFDGINREFAKLVGNEKTTFYRRLGDEEVRLVTDRPQVRAYWTRRRREPERGSGLPGTEATVAVEVMPCLVTGDLHPPIALHPKIKGIPPLGDTKGGVQGLNAGGPSE